MSWPNPQPSKHHHTRPKNSDTGHRTTPQHSFFRTPSALRVQMKLRCLLSKVYNWQKHVFEFSVLAKSLSLTPTTRSFALTGDNVPSSFIQNCVAQSLKQQEEHGPIHCKRMVSPWRQPKIRPTVLCKKQWKIMSPPRMGPLNSAPRACTPHYIMIEQRLIRCQTGRPVDVLKIMGGSIHKNAAP